MHVSERQHASTPEPLVITLCACLIVLLALSAQAASPDVLEIPFEYASNRGSLLLHVRINDKSAILIVDTGSTHTVLCPEFLGIKRSEFMPTKKAASGGTFVGDALGQEVRFQVGTWKWPKRRVSVMDLSAVLSVYDEKIDGVLGLDFFQEFSKVTINVREKTIAFMR